MAPISVYSLPRLTIILKGEIQQIIAARLKGDSLVGILKLHYVIPVIVFKKGAEGKTSSKKLIGNDDKIGLEIVVAAAWKRPICRACHVAASDYLQKNMTTLKIQMIEQEEDLGVMPRMSSAIKHGIVAGVSEVLAKKTSIIPIRMIEPTDNVGRILMSSRKCDQGTVVWGAIVVR